MTSPQDPTWGGPNSQYFDDAPTVVFAKIPSEPESADGDAKSSNPETPDKEPKPALTATDTKPRHFKATMKRLLSLLQPHKFAVFCVVVATIASIALSVAVPKSSVTRQTSSSPGSSARACPPDSPASRPQTPSGHQGIRRSPILSPTRPTSFPVWV